MSVKLLRTGAECRIPALGRGDAHPVKTGDVVEIPTAWQAAFLLADGSPDVGWAWPDTGPIVVTPDPDATSEET